MRLFFSKWRDFIAICCLLVTRSHVLSIVYKRGEGEGGAVLVDLAMCGRVGAAWGSGVGEGAWLQCEAKIVGARITKH